MREVETVNEALTRIRSQLCGARVIHYYVTDSEGRLVGVAPVRRLLLAEPSTLVGEMMVHPVYSVEEDTLFGRALEILAEQRLLALPVTDGSGRLTGVLDVSGTTRALAAMERQDSERKIFQTLGIRSGLTHRTVLSSLLVGLFLAFIVAGFQDLLAKAHAVAFFIPMILVTVAVSAMRAVTETVERLTWTKPRRGAQSGGFQSAGAAVAGALLAGTVAGMWQGSATFGCAMGCSLVIAFAAGGSLGHLIPRFVQRCNLEPKVAAGPIVTAIASVVALCCYLGLFTLLTS